MSVLCARQEGGLCTIHNKTTAYKLSEADNDENFISEFAKYGKRTKNYMHTPIQSAKKNVKLEAMDAKMLAHHALAIQEWVNEKHVKSIQDNANAEAREAKKLYETVLHTEDTFVKDVNDLLQYNDMLGCRKKEYLHKQWDKNVYAPIQREINKQMKGTCYSELDKRKRSLHKEYLEHTNKKGHVFLDTVEPAEYYPLSLHPVRPSLIVAETDKLEDPLLRQDRARSAEARLILRCTTGKTFTDSDLKTIQLPRLPMVPLGRHGTTCTTWIQMPLGNIESPVRFASRQRMRGDQNNSQFALSDWSRTFDNTIVDEELNVQKRRKFPQEHMMSQIPKLVNPPSKHDMATQVTMELKAIRNLSS